jgi:acyl-CoA synthetase (NDP forming)
MSPRSVALIGASDDPFKIAGRPLFNLRRAGFAGRIYPINSNRSLVQNERVWSSISALPEVPDHVYILSPAETVVETVEACASAKVPVVSILASGFSESGAEGAAREQQLRQLSAKTGIRILGPNSLGLVNVHERLVLTANAALAELSIRPGRTFVASHSGSMIGALVSRGSERGVGFAGMVSVGNEVDLCIGEICAALLDDPEIDCFMLFLETLRRGDALRDFARSAATRGKSIVAYKLGRSSAAAELAVSHTGALAGEDDIADAFLKDSGIARVGTLDAFVESPQLLRRIPLAATRGNRPAVGVVTTTGGGAAMVVDQLGVRGVTVEPPSAHTFGRLNAATGVDIVPAAIVDLTTAGARNEVMRAALEVMLSAPEFDVIVAVVGSLAHLHPDLVTRPIIDASSGPKPLVAFAVPEAHAALKLLTDAGVPNFRSPESCADAIAAALARRKPGLMPSGGSARATVCARMLDEIEAYGVLDRLGVPRVQSEVIEADDLKASEIPLPYPVVAKLLSAEIAHKTDVGGVVLGIGNAAELSDAISRMRADVDRHRPGTVIDRIIVQPMLQSLGEVLIGYRLDAQAGPIVILAAGGRLAEVYQDRSVRLAPLTLEIAEEMIGEVKLLRALEGYRGKPAGDLRALAKAIVAISHCADLEDLNIAEAEVNPLLVLPAGEGVVAVDALVRLE